ncbi:MAG: hypothetical protein AB1428_07215 [Bacteroidota bacterium]
MRLSVIGTLLLLVAGSEAGIVVHPQKVNVNASGATTVFLTFGGVTGYSVGEAVWCGEVMNAAPDIGLKPVAGTIFGTLPARFNLSRFSGTDGFTDIMSIPASVSRRAYQAAAAGAPSTFFYVRRFTNTRGGADEYVVVTCEMGGGGARSLFAFTSVALSFEGNETLLSVKQGALPPSVSATLQYNGTGQLHGRWEIVRPGDRQPTDEDLLTQASLPIEQRPQQQRYLEVGRFSVFLPPSGTYVLRGPDPAKLPTDVNGLYMILLRIECSLDVESTGDFPSAGVGVAPIPAGSVAGFPIPPLRYFVGEEPVSRIITIRLLTPKDMAQTVRGTPTEFSWTGVPDASLYRVVVITPSNVVLLSALIRPGVLIYAMPPWMWMKTDAQHVLWAVDALDDLGSVLTRSEWRTLRRGGP